MKKFLLRTVSLVLLSVSLIVASSLVIASAEAAPLPDFSELIEKSSPAVVKITAVTKARQAKQMRPLTAQCWFRCHRSPEAAPGLFAGSLLLHQSHSQPVSAALRLSMGSVCQRA